jgi:hypothetical protein
MRLLLFLILSSATFFAKAQIESYTIHKSDSIHLEDISFKKTAALHLGGATVLVEYRDFSNELNSERKGLKKQIRQRESILKRRSDKIVQSQLNNYKSRFTIIDSVYRQSKGNKSDTFHVDYNLLPIVNFIPSRIESKRCIILDNYNQKQQIIIKVSGSKKTGQWTAVGTSFYFIIGAKRYFFSKIDWVS